MKAKRWAFSEGLRQCTFELICYLLIRIAAAALSIFSAVYLGKLINFIQDSIAEGRDIRSIMARIAAIMGLLCLSFVLNSLRWRYAQDYLEQKASLNAKRNIIRITANIPIRRFDEEAFQNEYNRFCDTYGGLYGYVMSIFDLVALFYTLVTSVAILARVHIIFLPLVLVFLTCSCAANFKSVSIRKKMREEIHIESRRSDYFNSLFQGRHNRDTRLLGLGDLFNAKMREHSQKSTRYQADEWLKINRVAALFMPVGVDLSVLLSLFIGIVLIRSGHITAGMLYTIWKLTDSAVGNAQNVQRALTGYFTNNVFIAETYDFFREYGHNPKKETLDRQSDDDPIVITDLSYGYDESNQALDRIHLSIKKGECIALVGENGSGKSTLIKCILGFYQPQSGSVRILGKEAYTVAEPSLAERVGVVFQDFCRYPFTLRENVGFGDIHGLEDDAKITEALRLAGAQEVFHNCRDSLDCVLDRSLSEDGMQLSGGQWQKVALARTYLTIAEKDIFIFDEPTAALDPFAELEQFQMIRTALKGKTSILVSHRIGFARTADRIVVMKKGRIVETGSHEELMGKKGVYYSLFNAQRQWYIPEKEPSSGAAADG